jgi:alanine racemase
VIARQLTLEEVQAVTGGELLLSNPSHQVISQLLTDSRKVVNAEASLFFAIKGDNHDGHEFINELLQSGVFNFIISDKSVWREAYKANVIFVDDPLRAMQQLAAWHRSQFRIPVIGITGSNGKTIVKEWLYQLLREDKNIVRSPKSYNSQIGVPLSVWQMTQENNLGIFEAGISRPDEMENLEKIIHPTMGIFTNIGAAHDENFNSREEKVREKLLLFTNCATLFFCRDYPEILAAVNTLPDATLRFSWSRKGKAELQVARVTRRDTETEIQGIYKNRFIEIHIPFTDEASVENAIHCWAVMLFLGYENDVIAARMEMLTPVAMRLEMKEGINNCSVINDSYNSDIGSLTIALDFIAQQKQFSRRTVILSDILQSGRSEEALYKEVASLLMRKNVQRLIGIGKALQHQQDLFEMDKKFYSSTEDFLRDYNSSMFSNEAVLIKGARAFGFERISKALQQKAHETVLEINLNAVVHNLNLFRSRLKPETKLMVMVKAFAYGSGSFEIANTMQFHRADYLAVAYADEGVALRNAGISLPIMVMNPEEQSFDAMIANHLEPEIYNFRILNQFTDALRRHSPEATVRFPVHLELETGMRRLGFEEKELNELIIRIKNNRYIRIASIFSHLVASDESKHDPFTVEQVKLFEKMSAQVQEHFTYSILKHILNSAGILRFPEAQMDMVRLGIGLHGVAATSNEQRQLQMVATLKTTISQVKQVKAGETIGYSRKGIAKHDMTIATVGIGYADGFNRHLSNGVGKMMVMGQFAPVVGSVCMDMTMIDITGIQAKEGTEVIVFGSDYSILEIAKQLDTIPYEVLTGISARVKRVYFHE